jgi:hyperosmotically inducible protein
MKLVSQLLIRTTLSLCLFAAGGALATAQQTPDQSTAPQTDNTKMNQRDRNATEATADQQKMNRSDRDITQQIRKSIASDKSLSTYGHNVKVITLKGPVRSEEEKKAVEDKAAEVAGADKITNEIDVQPKQ